MNEKHALVYIPGLGDHRIAGQQRAVRAWHIQGVEAHLFQMKWEDGEDLAPKLERLLARVDHLHVQSKTVSLVSASAVVKRRMPVAGHFIGIAYGLTIGSFSAIRFLKNLP